MNRENTEGSTNGRALGVWVSSPPYSTTFRQSTEQHHCPPEGRVPQPVSPRLTPQPLTLQQPKQEQDLQKDSEDQGTQKKVSFNHQCLGPTFFPQSSYCCQMIVHYLPKWKCMHLFCTNAAYYTHCSFPRFSHLMVYLWNDSKSTHINWSHSFKTYRLIFMLRFSST